jgi:protease-4
MHMNAKVDAAMNTLPDQGPLLEVAVPPAGCGQHPHGPKVALIDVDGLMLNIDTAGPYSMAENPVAVFAEKLQCAGADPEVKAVVFRINSPGGSVGATEVMWQTLVDFRHQTGKPVVACLLDLGAGGGYYLASACDQIVAIPTSVVGGIGVILNSYFLELTMEHYNVYGEFIKAGDHIDMGTVARKISPEEKDMLTAMAAEYQATFKKAVLAHRPRIHAEAPLFDGRIMTATKARQDGLIDAVGSLPEAINLACKLATVENATAVMYRRATNPARSLYHTVPESPQGGGSLTGNQSIPGLDRSKLPLFLYMWQADPTLVRTPVP